jgi:hypothetical protein
MPCHKILCGLIAAAAVASIPALSSAQEVPSVQVEGRAPTELRIALGGKSTEQVKREVSVAAGTVCRNAATNHELPSYDVKWCRGATRARALNRYAAIMRHNHGQFASAGLTFAVR